MLRHSLRIPLFSFRQRALWQNFLATPCSNLQQLRQGLTSVQKTITTLQDSIHFQDRINNQKAQFRPLFTLPSLIQDPQCYPTLDNTVTNKLFLELSNFAMQSNKDKITGLDNSIAIDSSENKQNCLDLLVTMINQMQLLINTFSQEVLRSYQPNIKIINQIRRRFSLIEEILCQNYFKDYANRILSQDTSQSMKNKKTKHVYKQDFKFELSSAAVTAAKDSNIISKLSQILYVFSKMNMGSAKLYLLAELFVKETLRNEEEGKIVCDDGSLDRWLFVLAHANRFLRMKDNYLLSRMLQFQGSGVKLGAAYYAAVNTIPDYPLIQKIYNLISQLNVENLDEHERMILNCVVRLFGTLHPQYDWLALSTTKTETIHVIGHEESIWKRYITKKHYIYTLEKDEVLGENLYKMSINSYLFIDHRFVMFRTELTGVATLLKNYYKAVGKRVVMIYGYHVVSHDKRNESYEYFEEKIKKEPVRDVERQKVYDF